MKKIFYSIIALAAVAFTMVSCEDIPMPYDNPLNPSSNEIAPSGDGLTVATAYNVAAIDSLLDAGFSTDDSPSNPYFYIKGIICSRPSITTSYGNATYYISDDGTSNNQFYIYRSLSYGGTKFTDTNALQYGDTVVVYTQVYSYNGTYETRSGVCQLVSVNHKSSSGGSDTPSGEGAGTLASPYNVAQAYNIASGLQKSSTSASYYSDEVYVKGKISQITDTELSSYGNITYYISDDGTTSTQLEVYRGFGLDGAKFTALSDLKVGDEVIVVGKLQNWLGTYEFTSGSTLYSLNGKTSGGSVTPSGSTDITSAKAAELALALDDKATSTETYNVTGYITSVVGTVSMNQQSFWIADTKDGGKVFEAYWANLPEGVTEFTEGTKVKLTGNLMRYGSTAEMKNATVTILEQGGGDTPTPTPSTAGLTIDGTTVTLSSGLTAGTSSVSVDLNTLGLANAAEAGTITLSDGSTITFGLGTDANAAKFYTATKGIRVYGGNTMTFNCKGNIAKIVMTCDSYSGTNYVGTSDATVSITGSTAVYTGAGKGTTQLRVQTITIYYASGSSAKASMFRR